MNAAIEFITSPIVSIVDPEAFSAIVLLVRSPFSILGVRVFAEDAALSASSIPLVCAAYGEVLVGRGGAHYRQ